LRNEKSLNPAGESLEGNRFGLAVVAANTEVKSDKHENLVLAQVRIMVVRQYLADNFNAREVLFVALPMAPAQYLQTGLRLNCAKKIGMISSELEREVSDA
jgi:hypothetical protein